MLLEGVRIFYPKLYIVIRSNPETFLEGRRELGRDDQKQQRNLETIQRPLEGLDALEKESAKHLLETLFPRVKGVFGNTVYGPDWDKQWWEEQKICSDEHFRRYFAYCVPAGEIGDQEIRRFLEGVASGDETAATEKFLEMARRGAPKLISALRSFEGSIEPETAKTLAQIISVNASVLPQEKTFLGVGSTFSQAAILVMKLLHRIPEGAERVNSAQAILKAADPLPFACECFRWFLSDKEKPESERVLPSATERELGTILCNRVKEAAAHQPPYLAYPENSVALLAIWNAYGPNGEVRAYLEERFSANPQETIRFLVAYLPTEWSGQTGLPRKADLMREGYNAVSKLIDPDFVARQLKVLYGAKLDSSEYPQAEGEGSLELRTAQQFVHIHQTVLASKPPDNSENGPVPAE